MSMTEFVFYFQSFNVFTTLAIMYCVFQFRKIPTIENGMWTLLESIASGALLMEFEIYLQRFTPSVVTCMVTPWVREIGFVTCYGSINLKLYRIMMHFRTRRAHQYSSREMDLLYYLFLIILVTILYMTAWTVSTLNYINDGYDILVERTSRDGRKYQTCRVQWWSYVTETGELTLLMIGVRFAMVASQAIVRYDERRFLYYSLVAEAVISTIFYAIRPTLIDFADGDTDLIILILYIRGLCTNMLTLMLVFLPKFLEDLDIICQQKFGVVTYSEKSVEIDEHEYDHDIEQRSGTRQLLDLASLYII